MTLHTYPELEQGSDAWLAARCGMLTASTIGRLITPKLQVADNETSRGLTMTLAAERITGHVEYVHPSYDMQRGTADEPYARDLYSEHYAPVDVVGFITEEFDGHTLGGSPDGLVGIDGGIEIKSRAPKAQLKFLLNPEVPAENMAQIQACLLITGRSYWDYVSYAGGWPLGRHRVRPDPAWQAVILEALHTFETNVARIIADYTTASAGLPVAPRIDHFMDVELKL